MIKLYKCLESGKLIPSQWLVSLVPPLAVMKVILCSVMLSLSVTEVESFMPNEMRLSINHFNLQAPCILYIRTGISLLSREHFLYIFQQIYFII